MKLEENWPRGLRGEVFQRCGWMTDRWTGDDGQKSDSQKLILSLGSGELKKKKKKRMLFATVMNHALKQIHNM